MDQDQALVVKKDADLFVLAKNPQQMLSSHSKLILWADHKMQEVRSDVDSLKENLAKIKEAGWETHNMESVIRRQEKRFEFYEKLKAALSAGYYIVPDMSTAVFALRTKRKKPVPNTTAHSWSLADQTSESPKLGEGEYVNPNPVIESSEEEKEDGKKETIRWAEEWRLVDFPFKTVHPEIITEVSRAMAMKIFDEVGIVSPQGSRSRRGGDPMIVGRVNFKNGYTQRSACFVIAWFLREQDLTI